MKYNLEKLKSVLKRHEKDNTKQFFLLVYFAVVILQLRFNEVSEIFGLSEKKVRHVVTVIHVKMGKKQKLFNQSKNVYSDFNEIKITNG